MDKIIDCSAVSIQSIKYDERVNTRWITISDHSQRVALIDLEKFEGPKNGLLPTSLVATLASAICMTWEPQIWRTVFGLPQIVPLVAVRDIDEMALKHSACPYRIPPTRGYSPYLLPELVYGHYFGPLSRSMAAAHFARFKSPYKWSKKCDLRYVIGWDFPTEPEQFVYLYNHGRSPFVSLTLLTTLELGPCFSHHTVGDALTRAIRIVHRETNPPPNKKSPPKRILLSTLDKMLISDSGSHPPKMAKVGDSDPISSEETVKGCPLCGRQGIDRRSVGTNPEDPAQPSPPKPLPPAGSNPEPTPSASTPKATGSAPEPLGDQNEPEKGDRSPSAESSASGEVLELDTPNIFTDVEATDAEDPDPEAPAVRADQPEAYFFEDEYKRTHGSAAGLIPGVAGDPGKPEPSKKSEEDKKRGGPPIEPEHDRPPRFSGPTPKPLTLPASGTKLSRENRFYWGTGVEVPFRYQEWVPWRMFCGFCGSRHHLDGECVEFTKYRREYGFYVKDWPMLCHYELCEYPRSHFTVACPTLHRYCPTCRHRGHAPLHCGTKSREQFRLIYKAAHDPYLRRKGGRYTRRGERDVLPMREWSFHGPKKDTTELREIRFKGVAILADWNAADWDKFENAGDNEKMKLMELEITR